MMVIRKEKEVTQESMIGGEGVKIIKIVESTNIGLAPLLHREKESIITRLNIIIDTEHK